MTDLAAAAERVARAVERLETAARRRSGARAGGQAERDRLGVELKRAKSELAQLETVTDGVSLRLDDAIDRLRAALDS
jgi:hypothetical protein